MATLISAYDRGILYGRCDANCYEGKGDHCNCICGGKNHGIGLPHALIQTAEHASAWQRRDRHQRRSRSIRYELLLLDQASLF